MKRPATGKFGVLLAGVSVFLLLSACSKGGAASELRGAWHQQNTFVAPHTAPPVLELRKDGTALYDTSGPGSLTGTYEIEGNSFRFSAWPNKTANYSLKGDTLTLTSHIRLPGAPQNLPALTDTTTWKRIDAAPLYESLPADREKVPGLLESQLEEDFAAARAWQSDAYPVSLTVSPYSPGFFLIDMRFESRAAGKLLIFRVRPHFSDAQFAPLNGSPSPTIPAQFIDLPEALSKARAAGLSGELREADLRNWPGRGAAWMLSSASSLVTLDAADGHLVKGDVTGTITQYNSQWDTAMAGLKKLLAGNSPCANPLSFECDRERDHQRWLNHQIACNKHIAPQSTC